MPDYLAVHIYATTFESFRDQIGLDVWLANHGNRIRNDGQ